MVLSYPRGRGFNYIIQKLIHLHSNTHTQEKRISITDEERGKKMFNLTLKKEMKRY